MKKIFTFIGIMVIVFSIYFMLLIADKSIFVGESGGYDFSLSKQIELEKLEQYAKKCNISVNIVTINNYSFGNVDCQIEIINNVNQIKNKEKNSLFPNQHVKVISNKSLNGRKTKYFFAKEDNPNKIEKLKKLIENNGIETEVSHKFPIKFNVGMLFSTLNIGFFVAIFCMTLFCTALFYISRQKEIAILKLNGWPSYKISLRFYRIIIEKTLYGLLFGAILFSVYIIIMDNSKLFQYLEMVILLTISLNCVFFIVAIIAVVFINNSDYIQSIKNKKYNGIIYISIIVFKVILMTIAFIMSTKLIENIIRLNDGSNNIAKIEVNNWYIFTAHSYPTLEEEKEINSYMEQFDDNDVFNYCPSDIKLNRNDKPHVYKTLDGIDTNMIIMSHNLLKYIEIKDKDGNVLKLDGKKNYLLIPENLWKMKDKIIEYEGYEDIEEICIASGQWIEDYEIPGKYSYNSVIAVEKLVKNVSIGYGYVFMTEPVAKKMEQKLLTMGYEKSSVELEPLSEELRMHISTYQTELFESVIYSIIIFLTYLLVDLTLFSIYYEFKKKKMAVYSLLGHEPIEDIYSFIIYNVTIVIIVGLIVNKLFILLTVPETILFYLLLKRKSFENIPVVIKGR